MREGGGGGICAPQLVSLKFLADSTGFGLRATEIIIVAEGVGRALRYARMSEM